MACTIKFWAVFHYMAIFGTISFAKRKFCYFHVRELQTSETSVKKCIKYVKWKYNKESCLGLRFWWSIKSSQVK